MFSGQPPLQLTGEFISLPAVNRPGTLFIMASGIYSQVQTGHVEIRLPRGLKAIKGDLVRTIHTYGDFTDNQWELSLQPAHPGVYVISGTFAVDVGGTYGRDEMDFMTTLTVISAMIVACGPTVNT